MIYLSLSEATALNFLGPLGSLILTRCLSFPTARWNDCIGALGALLGVIFVAQPESIFGKRAPAENGKIKNKSVHGHLKGLAFGIFGVFGGVVSNRVPAMCPFWL
jgi:drug/metabolite transporter (DMT)-like permease